jgi:putative heme-binding domain-containing protein
MGPDLTDIGASRSANNLRESIIDPDAQVAPQYWIVSFEDHSGNYVKGFLLNEDTYTVQLLEMGGNLRSYDKATVSGYKVDKHSAMPSYRASLTSDQLNNLVAYLWSLRPE